jgi:hypothetical protein
MIQWSPAVQKYLLLCTMNIRHRKSSVSFQYIYVSNLKREIDIICKVFT